MRNVELNGTEYRCGKLPTRVQLYVTKRLLPVMRQMLPLFVRRDADGNAIDGGLSIYEAMAVLSDTIGQLSDADADFVLDATLACVAWRQGTSWQPLRAPGGAFLISAADRLDVQLRLFWEVLQESLSDFSLGLLLPFLSTGNGLDQEETLDQAEQADPTVMRRPTAGLNS